MKELENTVVHLPTQEEFNEYMEMCEKAGWKWRGDFAPFNFMGEEWEFYRKDTCVNICNGFGYGSIQFHQEQNDKIITFKNFKKMTK